MLILEEPIPLQALLKCVALMGEMLKGVVDIQNHFLALDAELHADLEKALLEKGSEQENLWGINLYPFENREKWIEYTSLINIRPSQGNDAIVVKDQAVREQIREIVEELIPYDAPSS